MESKSSLPESLLSLTQGYRMAMRQAIDAKELGLNAMVVYCLRIIQGSPQCTANTIVQKMERDKAQVARLVKEMIALGLIEKHPNPEDRRSQLLLLTEEGKSLAERVAAAELMIAQKMCQGIGEEEIMIFQRVAVVMAQNLTGMD